MRLRGTPQPSASGERVLVELVESDDAGAGSGLGARAIPGGPIPPDGAAGTRHRGLWWVGAAVLVVLAVVVTVANAVEARRAAERRASLAELAWVLPAIDGPLEEAWRVPGTWVIAVASDVMVVQDIAGGLLGIDPDTGVEVWTLGFEASGYCGSMQSSWPYAMEPEEAGDPVLLCQSPNEVAVDTGAWQTSAIRTIDARTGETLAELSVDGAFITAAFAEDDLVLVTTRQDDTVMVTRTDPRTGESKWRYEGEPGSGDSNFAGSYGIDVTDTAVLVDGMRDLALSVDTGEVLPEDEVPATDDGQYMRLELADGSILEWAYGDPSGLNSSGRVLDTDGSVRFAFEGTPQWSAASDLARTVLVVQRLSAADSAGTTVALDIQTGEELWSKSSGWSAVLLELDGHLLMTSDVARMVDQRTGRELWQSPVDPSVTIYTPITDGDVVLLPVRDDGQQLVAVDLDTGEEQWRIPAPNRISALAATTQGLAVAITDSEVIAYRP